jgi:polar amino acid transport system substrate-binding protein
MTGRHSGFGRCRILALLFISVFIAACGSIVQEPDQALMEQQLPAAVISPRVALDEERIAYTDEQLTAYPSEMRELLGGGKLRIAMYKEDRYPFFYVNEQGALQGSDVELARDIAFKLGVQAEFVRTASSFNEVIDQISRGEADIGVSKLSMTMERAKKVLFSDSYLNLKQALLINRLQLASHGKQAVTDDPVTIIQDRGDRVGIVKGTSYAGFAKALFPNQEQQDYSTSVELFEAVRDGDILAAVYDAFEINRYLKKYPSHSLQLQFVQLDDQNDDIAIAVSPQYYHLQQWINVYLHIHSKEISKLHEHYLGLMNMTG